MVTGGDWCSFGLADLEFSLFLLLYTSGLIPTGVSDGFGVQGGSTSLSKLSSPSNLSLTIVFFWKSQLAKAAAPSLTGVSRILVLHGCSPRFAEFSVSSLSFLF